MNKGFTLIEMILYVAILAIMMTALVPFASNVIMSSAKSATQQELSSSARILAEKIKYEIRRASGVTSVSATSLSLTNFSPDSTTVIDLSGGKVRINKNGGGVVNLNSDDTTVSSLTFTNYTSGTTTENVQFVFTIDSNANTTRQEYLGSITVEGDGEVRSN